MRALVVLAGVALSALIQVSPVAAQTPTPASPDAPRLELAREVLAASGGAQAMEAQMRVIFSGAANLTKKALSNADPKASEISDSVMKYVADEELQAVPELMSQVVAIYADNLSERELRDLLAWSLSPSAQEIRAKMPVITQQLIAEQGPLMNRMMAGVMAAAIDRACADKACTDDQRKALSATAQRSLPPS